MKKALIFGLIVLLTGFSAYAFARGGEYGPVAGGYHMMGNGMYGYGHMWQNLTPEDQEKMKTQMDTFFESTKELRAQHYEKRAELNRLYSSPEKNQTKIDTLKKELIDISAQLGKQRVDHMTEMNTHFAGRTNGLMTMRSYRGCF